MEVDIETYREMRYIPSLEDLKKFYGFVCCIYFCNR